MKTVVSIGLVSLSPGIADFRLSGVLVSLVSMWLTKQSQRLHGGSVVECRPTKAKVNVFNSRWSRGPKATLQVKTAAILSTLLSHQFMLPYGFANNR